jgi:hypothetical protein
MTWGLSPSKYVIQAVKNCQLHLTEKLAGRYSIPARADDPFPVDYDHSTDLSDIFDPDCSSFYQHFIGVMRWMVELGGPIYHALVPRLAQDLDIQAPHKLQPCIPGELGRTSFNHTSNRQFCTPTLLDCFGIDRAY